MATASDHHFVIGHQHTVCQDYCSSREGFAALSDGRSCVLGLDVKPYEAHTDIGARLLVRAAFHHREKSQWESPTAHVINTANEYRRSLDLSIDTLSATLITICDRDDKFIAAVCGDGLIAARRRGGKWELFANQYEPIPYYPRYMLEDVQPDTNLRITRMHSGDSNAMINRVQVFEFNKIDYDCVVGLSDGAFSFLRDGVPHWDLSLALRLLDLRRTRGRFVLRNLTGILKELAAENIIHQDDISMIALFDDGVK